MKRYLLLSLVGLISYTVAAQNKTFSVGTTTPNANAAMQVEAPNSNQGFIMPRLTTAQRTAAGFQGALSTTDIGLMVYDTDLKGIYIWDGAKWGAAARLPLPYQDSVATPTGTNNLLTFKYNNAELKRLLRLENLHPNNPGSTVSALQQGTGLAGYFQVNNATAGGTALQGTTNSDLGGVLAPVGVYGESTGSGSLGGAFRINNAANTFPAIYSETNGLGNAASFRNINASNNVAALRVETNGTGPSASVNSLNASSTSPGLIVNYAGTGNAIQTSGKVQAGQFVGDGSGLTNLPAVSFPFSISQASASTLFDITNSGTASAGKFTISNAASTGYALVGESNGALLSAGVYGINTGSGFGIYGKSNGTALGSAAVYGEQLGTGDAAGAFRINNVANTISALYGETNGTAAGASAIRGLNLGGGNGAYFRKNGSNATTAAMWADNFGTDGYGAIIQNVNGTNTKPALFAEAVGTGPSILAYKDVSETGPSFEARHTGPNGNAAYFYVSDPGNGGSSVYARNDGTGIAVSALSTGTGSAGSFETNNAGNTNPALYANSNSTSAPALSVSQSGGFTGITVNSTGGQAAEFYSNNPSQAFYVANTGSGRAGVFTATGTGNATLQAQSSDVGGSALSLFTNQGFAIDVQSGATKQSVVTYSTPGTMSDKAGVYVISAAGTYTLDNTGRQNGETLQIVYTGLGGLIIDGLGPGAAYRTSNVTPPAQWEIMTFIFVSGYWVTKGMYAP